ncbi:type II secretion system protein GspG [Cerasicoccus maritimus]|uniref:type II secretion system protein GspG n=1 Tax=Cerasicoccus maritimus TaxID=490089 RepID=UPI0028529F0A|nr:type II secretion system protein GspG [Cerasicoccus maritimus]
MKQTPFLCLALASACASLLADDSIDNAPPPPKPEATAAALPVGRFLLNEAGNTQLLIDTATGRVWQVTRRAGDTTLTPVHYEHGPEAKTPLPDYTPPPDNARFLKTPADPKLEAERQATAREFINEKIDGPIMTYTAQVGAFPTSLAQLSTNLGNNPRWQGPYIRETLIDPWGNHYKFLYPGIQNPDTYDVWSLGPDGIPSEDDIGNW